MANCGLTNGNGISNSGTDWIVTDMPEFIADFLTPRAVAPLAVATSRSLADSPPAIPFDVVLDSLQAAVPSEQTVPALVVGSTPSSSIPATDLPVVLENPALVPIDDVSVRLAIAGFDGAEPEANEFGSLAENQLPIPFVDPPAIAIPVLPIAFEQIVPELTNELGDGVPVEPLEIPEGELRSRADVLQLARSPIPPPSVAPIARSTVEEATFGINAIPVEEAPATESAEPRPTPTAIPVPLSLTTPAPTTPGEAVIATARPVSVPAQATIVPPRSDVIPAETTPAPILENRPPAESIVRIAETRATTVGDERPLPYREPVAIARESAAARPSSTIGVFPSVPDNPEPSPAPSVESIARPATPIPTGGITIDRIPLPTAFVPSDHRESTLVTLPSEPSEAAMSFDEVAAKPAESPVPFIADPPRVEGGPVVASAARSAASPVSAQLADGVVEHASIAARDGKVEFHIRLDPQELGPVKVKLVAHGDRLSAEVVVSNDAIRSLVESQLPELRSKLEQAGVSLPDVDVSTGGGGDRRGADADERPRSSSEPRVVPGRLLRAVTSGATSGTVDITV
jgi:flagellar hook-length control protein FliK